MINQPIVMLDFETSGMSPDQGARITEVAALRIVDGRISERFVSLVNCRVRIPPFISGLTGITQTMVDRAPPVAEVLPALLDFIGRDALAAHNAGFDEKFLLAESTRLQLQPRHQQLICSLKLARRLLPGQHSYKLGALAATLGIRFQGKSHRAEADAEVTAHLLLHMGRELCRQYQLPHVDGALLSGITRQTAAKVPLWLKRQAPVPVNGELPFDRAVEPA